MKQTWVVVIWLSVGLIGFYGLADAQTCSCQNQGPCVNDTGNPDVPTGTPCQPHPLTDECQCQATGGPWVVMVGLNYQCRRNDNGGCCNERRCCPPENPYCSDACPLTCQPTYFYVLSCRRPTYDFPCGFCSAP